jgi:prepilin-type N-terminal cleavage/methylation domain-containing protein
MVGSSRNLQRGFSLIEVIMATAILLVGFVGLIQAVTIGTESLDTARKLQIANQIVAAEIENLRGGPWSTIANLPASGTLALNGAGAISGDATSFALANRSADRTDDNTALCTLAKGFTCSVTRTLLRPVAASATTVTYVQLVYSVDWKSATGRVHTHRLGTYLGRNGLHLSFQQ